MVTTWTSAGHQSGMHLRDSGSYDARQREDAFQIASACRGPGQPITVFVNSIPINLRSPIQMQDMPAGHFFDDLRIVDFTNRPSQRR